MSVTGIPLPSRTRSLGHSTSGKRIVPKRAGRAPVIAITEDAETPIKPRIVSAPLGASMRESGERSGKAAVLGESRGGVNVKRIVTTPQTGDKDGLAKEGNLAVFDRRLKVLEANWKSKDRQDGQKFGEINSIIADIRAELALRSMTSAPFSNDAAQTPRIIRGQSCISTPSRPSSIPSRLSTSFDVSEFGVSNNAVAAATGSPPVPAVVSRRRRESAMRRISLADISSSFIGDETMEEEVKEVKIPRTLEEDISMGDMSYADLSHLSEEEEEEQKMTTDEGDTCHAEEHEQPIEAGAEPHQPTVDALTAVQLDVSSTTTRIDALARTIAQLEKEIQSSHERHRVHEDAMKALETRCQFAEEAAAAARVEMEQNQKLVLELSSTVARLESTLQQQQVPIAARSAAPSIWTILLTLLLAVSVALLASPVGMGLIPRA